MYAQGRDRDALTEGEILPGICLPNSLLPYITRSNIRQPAPGALRVYRRRPFPAVKSMSV